MVLGLGVGRGDGLGGGRGWGGGEDISVKNMKLNARYCIDITFSLIEG